MRRRLANTFFLIRTERMAVAELFAKALKKIGEPFDEHIRGGILTMSVGNGLGVTPQLDSACGKAEVLSVLISLLFERRAAMLDPPGWCLRGAVAG